MGRMMLLLVGLCGCTQIASNERETTTSGMQAAPATSPVAAVATPAPMSVSPGPATTRTEKLGALTLRYYSNGWIALSGKDRWGNAYDTTYESVDYLRQALPALGRMLTQEQMQRLDKAIGR